jgi:DNA mismatch repair protein MutS2
MMNDPARERSLDAFAHAAEALDLSEVLEHIASRCQNPGARAAVQGVRPTNDPAVVADRLDEIRETRAYHADNGRLRVVDTSVRDWVIRARDKKESIPPLALVAIAAAEGAVPDLQRVMKKGHDLYPKLFAIAARMTPHADLAGEIDRCLERDGTLKDRASPVLFDLRKRIARAKTEIRRMTDSLAKSLGELEYATFTGSRYLLLVPREKCRRQEGIVHAMSHSGGSLYFEPFSLVEKNNSLETLFTDARAEEARIVNELTSRVVAAADELLENLRLWDHVDSLNAIAEFAQDFSCTQPTVASDDSVRLAAGRHPLLELSLRAADRAHELVPLDLRLEPRARVIVITGPNAGGKTVTLKTAGLLALMFQCGLPVPCAEGTVLPLFDSIHADIGDEQSIASSLSTFTSHLRRLDVMCRAADEKSLCLIDEIGDGTDPDEGSALAIATIERLIERSSAAIVTTHYGKIKAFALSTPGVENASMLFDDETSRPLYRLLQGTAGRSRGLETARRVGFCEPVIQRAEAMLGKDAFRLESLLSELEATRLGLERDRAILEREARELTGVLDSYRAKERELSEFRNDRMAQAKKEAQDVLLRARKEIEAIVKTIREGGAAKPAVREAHERLDAFLETVRPPVQPVAVGDVGPGDRVSLSPSGTPGGTVISTRKDNVTVEIEGKRLTVKRSQLYRASDEGPTGEAARQSPPVRLDVEPLHTASIDVRGQDREDALSQVDAFLDRAILTGLREVTIIHGVGEEILLSAVQAHLRADPRVESIRLGGLGEGGRGVSVVRLK